MTHARREWLEQFWQEISGTRDVALIDLIDRAIEGDRAVEEKVVRIGEDMRVDLRRYGEDPGAPCPD